MKAIRRILGFGYTRTTGGIIMPKLFKTDIASDADLTVYVTDIRSEADLVVYETTSEWEATEAAVWCYTDIRTDADKVVHFADGAWNAQLVIFKTDVKSDAGWQNSGKSDLI